VEAAILSRGHMCDARGILDVYRGLTPPGVVIIVFRCVAIMGARRFGGV